MIFANAASEKEGGDSVNIWLFISAPLTAESIVLCGVGGLSQFYIFFQVNKWLVLIWSIDTQAESF